MEEEQVLGREQAEAGAVFGTIREQRVARHFGDPQMEYRAATEGCGVSVPERRVLVTVTGRSPAEMIQGVITNSVPPPLQPGDPETLTGASAVAAILTPKGRMITDLWVGWWGSAPESGLLVEFPGSGAPGALEHLSRFLPPRLARATDRTGDLGVLQVLGPEGADLLARVGLGFRVESEFLAKMGEGEVVAVGSHPGAGLRVRRSADLATPVWEVLADLPTIRGLWRSLLAAGASPVGAGVTEALRVEAGRPAFGQDMGADTIPIEAGIGTRAIDHGKGCYTGQEVIVRIRDRGHVNRHLRGLRFGTDVAAVPGTPLFPEPAGGGNAASPESDGGTEDDANDPGSGGAPDGASAPRQVGVVTSEALSPRVGRSIGLGYVRREVPVLGYVRLGEPDGPRVEVRELSGPGWALDGAGGVSDSAGG
jgi:folate-binding protein YgfZ